MVDGAGRTDTGVHAAGQVIGFTYRGRARRAALRQAVNALLPPDVAIRGVRRVPDGFHPRYAARYREYRYTVWNGPRSPLRERHALGVRTPLDIAAMASAGSVFEGRHDFSAFGGTGRSPVRTVYAVRVRREGRLVTIDVRAESFLRGQVRRMVAALLEVGLGTLDIEGLRAALAGPGPALNGASAPAKGLCLRRVVLGGRPRTTRKTRNEREDLYASRERDRASAGTSLTRRTRRSAASRRASRVSSRGSTSPPTPPTSTPATT